MRINIEAVILHILLMIYLMFEFSSTSLHQNLDSRSRDITFFFTFQNLLPTLPTIQLNQP